MNVTFHVVAAVGAAVALSSRQKSAFHLQSNVLSDLPLLTAAFVAGLLLHGLLDWLPHSYPINSAVDVGVGFALVAGVTVAVRPEHRLLFGTCAFSSVLPDLVDLGPAIINKRLGWSLPVFKVFPWHWRQYSGSIYDGSRSLESMLCHLLVVAVSLGLIWVSRRNFFAMSGYFQ